LNDALTAMEQRVLAKGAALMEESDEVIIAAINGQGAPTSGGGKGGGKGGKGGKGAPTAEQLAKREAIRKRNEAEKAKEDAYRAEHGERETFDYGKSEGLSPQEMMLQELQNRSKNGSAATGLTKVDKHDKSWQTGREVIDSSKKTVSSGGPKKKTVMPPFEGYIGNDYKITYLVGDRNDKEVRVFELESPRRDAVMIMDCEYVDITIVGIAKNISIAGCKNYRITVDGSIGQLEVSNSDSGYIKVQGRIYQLTADKCSGCEVTLCEAAYGADIVHSQCASLNIGLDNPDPDAEASFLTLAVPSQFKSKLAFDGKNVDVTTEAVSHNFG